MKKYIGIFLPLIMIVANFEANALVTVESLLLGENEELTSTGEIDPISYISTEVYSKDRSENEENIHKFNLKQYIGFFQEGRNLLHRCEKDLPLHYSSFDQKEHVKLSMTGTLQYIGLDLTSRAIVEYAHFFEFNEEEFQNLVRRIVGNYCSENLTVISLKQLAKNLLAKFKKKETGFILPDFSHNSYFPEELDSKVNPNEAKEREFSLTVKLFRAYCSWGSNSSDMRLLVPLISNPFIMSFIIRQMTNKKFFWNQEKGKLFLTKDQNTIQVFCENLICRRVKSEDFFRKIPSSLGRISISDDLSRMYCQEFKNVKYTLVDQEERIKKWIMQQSLEEENLLVSQMISLITGVPDIMVRSKSYNDLQDHLRTSMERDGNNWAERAGNVFSKDILFEESIYVEKVDRRSYFNPKVAKFQINFDVNLGEVDKTHFGIGKPVVSFPLIFSQKFLKWMRNEWMYRDFRWDKKNQRLIEILKIHIAPQLKKVQKKFVILPWKNELDDIIARELLNQLELYVGKKFDSLNDEEITATVNIRYGFFALKYFHYRFRARHGDFEIDL